MSNDNPKVATAVCGLMAATLGLIMAAVRGDSAAATTISYGFSGMLIGFGIDKYVEMAKDASDVQEGET